MIKKTIVAFIYDYDHTLSTTDMQNYSFFPSLNLKPEEFWGAANQLTTKEHMDSALAYMYLMITEAKKKNVRIDRDSLVERGKNIEFFPGVLDWFKRLADYGKERGVEVQHYVISSGNKEIIEGSEIYKYFKKVYGCEYLFDEDGNAVWPKNVINYTTKTQFIYRINKGILDIAENKKVNDSIPDEDKPIPFQNMVYIGDGMTDVPCMKLVRGNGGYSIAVYDKNKKPAKKLLIDGRVDYLCEADYSEGTTLDEIAKNIIDKVAPMDRLYKLHIQQVNEENNGK